MRHLIISFCLMMAALSIEAAPIDGIRIESAGEPIIVFIDGQQMCTPTVSCFVANLRNGSYRIEVYEAEPSRRGEQGRRGELIYKERVNYRGNGIKDIFVETAPQRPRPGQGHRPGGKPHQDMPMSDETFNEFLKTLRSRPFDDGKVLLIENALLTSRFTSEQCKTMVKMMSFDGEQIKILKKLYPCVVDQQNFFVAIEALRFSSSKTEVNNFIKDYHQRK